MALVRGLPCRSRIQFAVFRRGRTMTAGRANNSKNSRRPVEMGCFRTRSRRVAATSGCSSDPLMRPQRLRAHQSPPDTVAEPTDPSASTTERIWRRGDTSGPSNQKLILVASCTSLGEAALHNLTKCRVADIAVHRCRSIELRMVEYVERFEAGIGSTSIRQPQHASASVMSKFSTPGP